MMASIQVIIEHGSTAEWLTAFGTMALALATFAAVFYRSIISWFRRPKLELRILPTPPDCLKITMRWLTQFGSPMQADSYYLRVQVKNVGHTAAEMVELFLAEVLEQGPKGDFRPRQAFLPLNLVWSNFKEPLILLDHLSPHVPKHCDVAHIVDPRARASMPDEDNPVLGLSPQQTALSLELVVKPNSGSHLLPPGTYRLKLVLGVANAATVTRWVEIVHTGQWFSSEQQMLNTGLQIRLLDHS
jgi:hypothetical protein